MKTFLAKLAAQIGCLARLVSDEVEKRADQYNTFWGGVLYGNFIIIVVSGWFCLLVAAPLGAHAMALGHLIGLEIGVVVISAFHHFCALAGACQEKLERHIPTTCFAAN